MKENKLKKYCLRTGIIFFIILALLTFFSSTIDNMLLPKVKVTDVQTGSLDENYNGMETRYLLPVSAVVGFDGIKSVYVLFTDENNKSSVNEVMVNVTDSDDFYCEVTSQNLFANMQVVYSTSKDISDGDRVYVEEE